MTYNLSQNIEAPLKDDLNYIVTGNAKKIFKELVDGYNSGVHSYTIIGTYGTGKSSFLRAMRSDFENRSQHLLNDKFSGHSKFDFRPIVGDYTSLFDLLTEKLNSSSNSKPKNLFDSLDTILQSYRESNTLMVIVIDEFGKILEYAANNNPEKELYFIQQFAEFANRPENNILFITTLHQNFSAYAKKLTEYQRNEWTKVKGRFKELVFSEPVEQLLFLASEQLSSLNVDNNNIHVADNLFRLAQKSKIISPHLNINIARKLFPLDMFSVTALTQAIHRYGQNERSLFSFLNAKGKTSFRQFIPLENESYNLSYVYDYVVYNFHSYLSEINTDTLNWSAMRVALERVEGFMEENEVLDASKLIKAIGLLNLLGSSAIKVEKKILCEYASKAMKIENPSFLLDKLVALKIVRYAKYKSQYVLFDGTDINIEDELYKARNKIPYTTDIVHEINSNFNFRIIPAKSVYYKLGTPRFFQIRITSEPITEKPKDDTDGFINLIFPKDNSELNSVQDASENCSEAILFGFYNNTQIIKDHIREINKLTYVRDQVLNENIDTVAVREVNKLLSHERRLLNKSINQGFASFTDDITWYYKGNKIVINSLSDFNRILSKICEDVYYSTPIIRNELFNKQKVSSAISTARINLLMKLLEFNPEIGIEFEDGKYPPERAIFSTLLVNTNIYRQQGDFFILGPPQFYINDVWNECEKFFYSTQHKQRKLIELINKLKSTPYKLKQGFIDFWLPIYLIIKRHEFSLYDPAGIYLIEINREVLDLLQKTPNDFRIKAFALEGVKVEFFNKYRRILSMHDTQSISNNDFLDTIKPFLAFYNRLNDYAKRTENFNSPLTLKFRTILANATDPEKAFFEELPEAFGYNYNELSGNESFMLRYQVQIQESINELRSCYHNLILRIEAVMLDTLSLNSKNYDEYKQEIENRFRSLKKHLLTTVQKSFLNRLYLSQANKTAWYESMCYVLLNKPLYTIKDYEEPLLLDKLRFMFKTLSKFIDISNAYSENTENEIYKFDLVSSEGSITSETYILPQNKKDKVKKLENSINTLLSGDDNIDICVLLRLINSKIKPL